MPIGERFCLSFSLFRLTQKMELSPHTIGRLLYPKTVFESSAAVTETTPFLAWWLAFLCALVSAFCSQLAALLPSTHSLLFKISHEGHQDCDLHWISPAFAHSKQLRPFIGHTAVAASRTEGFHNRACEGCQREHQGWHFIVREAYMEAGEKRQRERGTGFASLSIKK